MKSLAFEKLVPSFKKILKLQLDLILFKIVVLLLFSFLPLLFILHFFILKRFLWITLCPSNFVIHKRVKLCLKFLIVFIFGKSYSVNLDLQMLYFWIFFSDFIIDFCNIFPHFGNCLWRNRDKFAILAFHQLCMEFSTLMFQFLHFF